MTSPEPDAALIADVFARDCTSRDVLGHVAGKWAVLALLALDEGGYRFNALRRRVEGVSEKMLAQTLQTLERDGLLVREVVTAIPPRVEYTLTPLGERVAATLRELADLHAPGGEVGGPRRRADDGDDVRRRDATGQQLLDDEAAEVAGGSGDGIGRHDGLLLDGTAQVLGTNRERVALVPRANLAP